LPILENAQNLDQIVFGTNNQFRGFTTFPLVNEGTGINYGVDVSLERYFKNNYYFLIAASAFESNYQSSDGITRNTPFNGRFGNTVLGGKEFRTGTKFQNLLGINFKTIYYGGEKIIPIDEQESINQGQTVILFDQAFDSSLENYFRIDLQISFRINKPKHTSEWRLDIQNLTDREHTESLFFSSNNQQLQRDLSLGIIPILSYRVEF